VTSAGELRERLHGRLAELGDVVVALSGGVDSSLLAVEAVRALGADHVLAVTAVSPSLATGEVEHSEAFARRWGVPWRSVRTAEMSDERYRRNDGDRCGWCKSALMDALGPIAARRGATVVLGVNRDDLSDHRPGQAVAAGRGARFPLLDAGLDKPAVRELARTAGLEVWDRPAMPCLASRIPYGTPVTVEVLSRVDRAEAAVRSMGFTDVRVRHGGDRARLEVPLAEVPAARDRLPELEAALRRAGYRTVEVDPRGLRSGNLNEALGVVATGRR
jgi:uncharacterized protein